MSVWSLCIKSAKSMTMCLYNHVRLMNWNNYEQILSYKHIYHMEMWELSWTQNKFLVCKLFFNLTSVLFAPWATVSNMLANPIHTYTPFRTMTSQYMGGKMNKQTKKKRTLIFKRLFRVIPRWIANLIPSNHWLLGFFLLNNAESVPKQ